MNRLLERDWRFLVDSLLAVHSAETIERFTAEVLDLLEYLIGADQIMFCPMRRAEDGRLCVLDMHVRGMPALFKDEFVGSAFPNDDYFYGWNRRKETNAFRDTDILPDDFRENSDVFRRIYNPQNIYYGLRANLVYKQEMLGNISLFNSKSTGDFSNRDLNVLSTIAPHCALKYGTLCDGLERQRRIEERMDAVAACGLTEREKEVAIRLLDGLPDAELCAALGITDSTFKKHVHGIYQKTGVQNRVQLFRFLMGVDARDSLLG